MIEFSVRKDTLRDDWNCFQRTVKLGKYESVICDEWNTRQIAEHLEIFAREIIRRETPKGE